MKTIQEKDKIPDLKFVELKFSLDINLDGNKVHYINEGTDDELPQKAKRLIYLQQKKEHTKKSTTTRS